MRVIDEMTPIDIDGCDVIHNGVTTPKNCDDDDDDA